MKIVFLDIDGVLNSAEYDRSRDWSADTEIDETRLPLVKRIIDVTGAKIVLSSTWREHWSADKTACDSDGRYIDRVFAAHGLEIYDKTPDLGYFADRRDEISDWLSCNDGVESFVIIDDSPFGWNELSPHFVKTNPHRGLGLEDEHVALAVKILNDGAGGR